jgi:hypothetical protein
MVDRVLKRTGLAGVLENLLPGAGDTIKSLVALRVTQSYEYSYAEEWYRCSYAKLLYPKATLEPSQISKLYVLLGNKHVYDNFFSNYLAIIAKNKSISEQLSLPILNCGNMFSNKFNSYLNDANVDNDIISKQIRLYYAFDQNTKLPIYFRHLDFNVIDNSAIEETINSLKIFNINVKTVIFDLEYSLMCNLGHFIKNKIQFIANITKYENDLSELIETYGPVLQKTQNEIRYGDKIFCGLKLPHTLFDKNTYAYLVLDLQQEFYDKYLLLHKYKYDSDSSSKIKKELPFCGTFIFISSNNYDVKDILSLYYTRQTVEQYFDISKYMADMIPLKGHSEETTGSHLLISFIAKIVYSSIEFGLKGINIQTGLAIYKMTNLRIQVYKNISLVEELTDTYKDIFAALGLDCPFPQQKRLELTSELIEKMKNWDKVSNNKDKIKPKGHLQASQTPNHDAPDYKGVPKKGRGRPKGSKNKEKTPVRK